MSGCPSDHSSLLSIAINWEVAAVWKSYCPHVVYSPTITSKTKFSFLTYEKNVQGSDIKFLLMLVIYCFPSSLLPTSLTFLLSCSFLISPRIPSLVLIPSFASPSVNRSTDCTCGKGSYHVQRHGNLKMYSSLITHVMFTCHLWVWWVGFTFINNETFFVKKCRFV